MRRILIISHVYISPSNRGKLRALAARGLDVTVGVPQRWRETVLGRTIEVAWERQNGGEGVGRTRGVPGARQGGVAFFPPPARPPGPPATLAFRGRALHALVRDKR